MGILKRFKDIMSANINAMLDKAEDPEKMIDQYLRDLQEDLRNVKSETATVMADETRCKRALDDCDADIAELCREGTSCRKRSRCHEVLREEESVINQENFFTAVL